MAIRVRRGNYADFDPSKMVAGELALCLDNGYVFMTIGAGNVVRLGTAETIEEAVELAEEYASNSEEYALDSEAYAIGKRDGSDVPSTDPAYHNNSKYWADRAEYIVDNFDEMIPTATVTKPSGSDHATITITDKDGTTTADVYDGAKGDKGNTGDAATIAVGTVTTLPAGSQATVTNSGTSSSAVFDFGLPRGADGQGAGDMTTTVYDPNHHNYVDRAGAITDGTNNLSYSDLNNKMDKTGVSVSEVGTASASGTRKQQITVNNTNYDVDGTKYMQQTIYVSTQAGTVTFNNSDITANSAIDFWCSEWGLVPDNISCSSGTCAITFPAVEETKQVTIRIYIR